MADPKILIPFQLQNIISGSANFKFQQSKSCVLNDAVSMSSFVFAYESSISLGSNKLQLVFKKNGTTVFTSDEYTSSDFTSGEQVKYLIHNFSNPQPSADGEIEVELVVTGLVSIVSLYVNLYIISN